MKDDIFFVMRRHVVYTLRCPRNPDLVRYVGRTSRHIDARLLQHIQDAVAPLNGRVTSRLGCWILALDRLEYPETPLVDAVEDDVLAEDIIEAEGRWIEHFRSRGAPLLNANSGGSKPYAWTLPPLTDAERIARCADPDYDLKVRK